MYTTLEHTKTQLLTSLTVKLNIKAGVSCAPWFLSGPVTSAAVDADAEEDAEEQRERVEDVDDARDVGDGEQHRTSDHHLYRPVTANHHVYISSSSSSRLSASLHSLTVCVGTCMCNNNNNNN